MNGANAGLAERDGEVDVPMMQSMLDCGFGGWLMTGTGFLFLAVLMIATAALIKHLFFAGRGGRGRSSS